MRTNGDIRATLRPFSTGISVQLSAKSLPGKSALRSVYRGIAQIIRPSFVKVTAGQQLWGCGILNGNRNRRGSEVCVQNPDGTYSDAAIHEQIIANVDDSDFRAETRLKLLALGVPASAVNSLFSDFPPLS